MLIGDHFWGVKISLWKATFKSLLSVVNKELYLKGNININEITKKFEFYESMLHTLKESKTFKADTGDLYNSGIWYKNEPILSIW